MPNQCSKLTEFIKNLQKPSRSKKERKKKEIKKERIKEKERKGPAILSFTSSTWLISICEGQGGGGGWRGGGCATTAPAAMSSWHQASHSHKRTHTHTHSVGRKPNTVGRLRGQQLVNSFSFFRCRVVHRAAVE